ncbi:PH domain-containing protein [Actomonas aquatica]|uniref:PH domain-containing protein n=1 Tax=Actomonas aquatica TaxID=2866162 RepID=A0ABZ1C447_9BACT|nr:PH domain-containing protein [Opitutus sp. WL0086]WRQ86486.1 PH domain-containing protein [Opitutus sp. WL0086]
MMARLEALLMRILKVPHEPAPPAGAPGSLRVFRAGKNYVRLKFLGWMGTQAAAVWGILVSIYFIREVEYQMQLEQVAAEQADVIGDSLEPVLEEVEPGVYVTKQAGEELSREEVLRKLAGDEVERRDMIHRLLERFVPEGVYQLARRTPPKVLFWIKIGEAIGIVVFVVQFFWSLGSLWLEYTQRWYMVTDRSLRLRWGIMKINETTMSFANLQQVTVKQGPLQRLLRLADVEVRSAGGGGSAEEQQQWGGESMHRSVFHAVENASEIRDLILERLKRFRQAGLGEPDDHNQNEDDEPAVAVVATEHVGGDGAVDAATLVAARSVLAEVRALREALR